MHESMKTFAVHSRVVGLLAALSVSVMLTSCATGQIDLTAEAPSGSDATITADRKFAYRVISIYHLECGIMRVDSTSMDKTFGAKTVTVPEGVHSIYVACNDDHKIIDSELSFFAQAGNEYTVGIKGACVVAIDNANEAEVKSDCEPSVIKF